VHDILLGAGIMFGLGLAFALVLALAYRFLRVTEDPKLERLEEMLPGTNCGACGVPGCRAFAESLIHGDNLPSRCTVSSPEGIEALADFLGVDPGNADKVVARLRCAGGFAQAGRVAEYEGFENCRAAALTGGGGKDCAWGCLGLGDCEVVCDFDAIHMNDNGLPVVDIDACTACNDCVEICPLDLFVLQPLSQPLFVQCNVPLAGEEATSLCRVACDACGLCVQDAPDGVIEMSGNLPRINPDRVAETTPAATFRCPTGAIQWAVGAQFERGRQHV
jgi:electron transport complex protein RnfB